MDKRLYFYPDTRGFCCEVTMNAPIINSVAIHTSASIKLSKPMQWLIMGIHNYDFMVGSDVVFIMNDLESGLKIDAELIRLTNRRDS